MLQYQAVILMHYFLRQVGWRKMNMQVHYVDKDSLDETKTKSEQIEHKRMKRTGLDGDETSAKPAIKEVYLLSISSEAPSILLMTPSIYY